MEIVRMTKEHAAGAAALEKKYMSVPWSEKAIQDSLSMEEYRMFAAMEGGRIVGYIGSYYAADEADITDVIVDEDFRRRGIAQRLVEAVTEDALLRQVSALYLEVRVSNEAAIALYRKAGFQTAGRRKNFYDRPKEDAFVMCLALERKI